MPEQQNAIPKRIWDEVNKTVPPTMRTMTAEVMHMQEHPRVKAFFEQKNSNQGK